MKVRKKQSQKNPVKEKAVPKKAAPVHDAAIEMSLNKKWTVRVDEDEFDKLNKALFYGQPSRLLRLFLASVNMLIDQGQLDDVLRYLYETAPLTLPVITKDV